MALNKKGEPWSKDSTSLGPDRSLVWTCKQFSYPAACPCSVLTCCCCCCCCCWVASVVSDSVQPHRWRPTRLPRSWDSPGKNTGVGCHFLLQRMHAKSLWSCLTLCNPMDSSPPGSSVHRILQARVLEWAANSFSIMSLRSWILSDVTVCIYL